MSTGIEYDRAEVEAFFGGELAPFVPEGAEPTSWKIEYRGPLLRYWFIVDEAEGMVSISGDEEVPFGSDSLYEVVVPCTSIAVCRDVYYKTQTGLRCFYGDPEVRGTMVLTLLKRPSGDLKVWPTISRVITV